MRIIDPTWQYSSGEELHRAGYRPDLEPTDTTPMELEVDEPNPDEVLMLRRQDILPLTPAGAQEVLVYPGVVPAPDETTDISYEDLPRDEHRRILRGQTGVNPWGPFPRPPVGPPLPMESLGQAEEDPIAYFRSPAEIAYQTYPGPFLGEYPEMSLEPALLATVAGGLVAIAGPTFFQDEYVKIAFIYIGSITAAIGLVNAIRQILPTEGEARR